MGVEGTLGIPANEAFESDKLRSNSPIVLPLVSELPDEDPADCPEVLGTRVWKMTLV